MNRLRLTKRISKQAKRDNVLVAVLTIYAIVIIVLVAFVLLMPANHQY